MTDWPRKWKRSEFVRSAGSKNTSGAAFLSSRAAQTARDLATGRASHKFERSFVVVATQDDRIEATRLRMTAIAAAQPDCEANLAELIWSVIGFRHSCF